MSEEWCEFTIIYGNKIIFDEKGHAEEEINIDDMAEQVRRLARYSDGNFQREGNYIGMIDGEIKFLVEACGDYLTLGEVLYVDHKSFSELLQKNDQN